ncbi:MAG: energy transducer TonB [Puniceicoccaceae bacterium]
MTEPIHPAHTWATRLGSVLGAAIILLGVFGLVLFGAAISLPESAALSLPPPLPITSPPPPPQEITETEEPPLPTLSQQIAKTSEPPSALRLEPLQVDFQAPLPAAQFSLPDLSTLTTGLNTREQIARFTFDDLDNPPRALYVPRPRIPLRLSSSGFSSGSVTFLVHIDKTGKVSVLEVLDYSDPDLVKPARDAANRSRFAPPTRNGEPVEVTGSWPLLIQTQ